MNAASVGSSSTAVEPTCARAPILLGLLAGGRILLALQQPSRPRVLAAVQLLLAAKKGGIFGSQHKSALESCIGNGSQEELGFTAGSALCSGVGWDGVAWNEILWCRWDGMAQCRLYGMALHDVVRWQGVGWHGVDGMAGMVKVGWDDMDGIGWCNGIGWREKHVMV